MHEPDNVTWMTAKGNKIQGNDSVQHAVEVIFNIAEYHKSRLSLDWDETENWEAEETE